MDWQVIVANLPLLRLGDVHVVEHLLRRLCLLEGTADPADLRVCRRGECHEYQGD